MDPLLSRTRQVYQRLHDALPRFLTEFEQPEPVCFLDFSDDGDQSDSRVHLLYEQTNRRGTRMGNQTLMASYFRLGRVLCALGTRDALKYLRRWAPKSKASHVYRTAIRVYEVFSLCGPSYLVATSLTPTIMREMPIAIYQELLDHLHLRSLSVHLQEQAPEGENSVTVCDALAAPDP
jgi:hypothetical protein